MKAIIGFVLCCALFDIIFFLAMANQHDDDDFF